MSATPNSNTDLTTIDGVQAYLSSTTYASHTVTALTGGTANFAYRIHLIAPIDGHQTYVLRSGRHERGTDADFLPVQIFEYEAMTRVKAWLPADSLVSVPTIYKFDKEHHVLIMEDCGTDILTLKDFMLQSRDDTSTTLAASIGTSLGHFIGGMHEWSRANPNGILDLFSEHKQALQVSAWATYGRLVQTLKPSKGDDVPPALADPPLVLADAEVDVVKRVAENFVMGDFWPGNIMFTLDEQQKLRKVYIFDWELAKPGLPGVEIGQFCAEVHLVRRYAPAAEKFTTIVLNTFLRAYAERAKPDIQIARSALTHWGTHLAVWTSRVSTWAEDKGKARSIVGEGVKLIVAAEEANVDTLSSSFVGPLVRVEADIDSVHSDT
ncbi:hypothetical protein DXG01_000993 [Tephrocybe rancida]|nr:hypothetical protein DXG01_000993 [Tephrocybe rancida]